ncbi:hypothetical protein PR048_010439, partial [Dryococelus australis]
MEDRNNSQHKDVGLNVGVDHFSTTLVPQWRGPFKSCHFLKPVTLLVDYQQPPNRQVKVHVSH